MTLPSTPMTQTTGRLVTPYSGATSSPLRSSLYMRGMTLAHGPHQLAQKSSTTTLPLYSASVCDTPSASLSVQSGAGSPTASSPALPLGSSPTPPREGQTAVRRQQTAITTPAKLFFIIPPALETMCPPGHNGVV